MADVNAIFSEYTRMRRNGVDTKAALNTLRAQIETLSKGEREQLAARVRSWESTPHDDEDDDEVGVQTMVVKPLPIKPLSPPPPPPAPPPANSPIRKISVAPPAAPPIAIDLGELQGKFDTRQLPDESTRVREDYYGADYTLQLQVRDSTEAFELRPQDFKHEVVLGRSAGDNSVRPDVDLSEQRGSELGVSRLHLGLRYDGGSNAVHVYDLGSANGSFINNQRLNPREVRFLRDGDQLRLGRLVMSVKFVQGT